MSNSTTFLDKYKSSLNPGKAKKKNEEKGDQLEADKISFLFINSVVIQDTTGYSRVSQFTIRIQSTRK